MKCKNCAKLRKEIEELKKLALATVLGSPIQDKSIVFLGRVHEQKGIVYLLEAFEMLLKEYPNYCLDIIGGCDDDYGKKLQKKYADGRIHWHGFVQNRSEIAEYLMSAYCIVLPSRNEGQPLTLWEGLASGRPVIGSDIPCFTTDNRVDPRLIVPYGDAKAIVKKIKWLIESPEIAEEIGAAGAKRAAKNDWSVIAKKTEDVYKEVYGDKGNT